ncbi:MAG: PCRF domain-containing protein [Candidatus Pacebacteria bacterium]|nr:PCRF domain-containing protein [Candidatus Paceibacterota bacterium]NUQ56964.1 PCRF domain-containing protein [Candidatus Paceibacter sp.]
MEKEEIKNKIAVLEAEMQKPDFWQDKIKAQEAVKELNELKEKAAGVGKYDKGDAVLTLFAGAGGDDAEDWVRMLFEMYLKFARKKSWEVFVLHEHKSEHGGYKNITFEIDGKSAYGTLKKEAGVHRLVRVSPFSAKKLRHTSFALLEVVPKFVAPEEVRIDEKDIRVDLMRSGGAGGQNVNKRETAVRIVHLPTNVAIHADAERSQAQNKERAMQILKAKLYSIMIKEQEKEKNALRINKTVEAEWGHQIRSYVVHPYKMVKDHRTNVETGNVDAVLEGELDEFIEAEKGI